jgi:hypothetical protein
MNDIQDKMRVRTVAELKDTTGIYLNPIYIYARRPDRLGRVMSYVPGYGGDVWWVEHDDRSVAFYQSCELVPQGPEVAGENQ